MGLTIVLEGITVQHAAELLLDTEITRGDRRTCRYTYLRCLEDFAFGLCCSDSLVVSRNLSNVGTTSPGRELLEHVSRELPGRITWIDDVSEPGPGTLLLDQAQRVAVTSWMARLSDAVIRDGAAWKEYILREFRAYAGNDASLSGDLPPERYTFARDFWIDRELEDAVPPRYIAEVMQVAPVVTSNGVPLHRNAQIEFIRRNALAHILIWQWYRERMVSPQLAIADRNSLPHVTRASLAAVVSQRHFNHEDRGWRIVVPRLLVGLMNRSRTRYELRAFLMDVASDDPGAFAFRRSCEVAIAEYVAGRGDTFERLRSELEAWAQMSPAQETLSITGVLGVRGVGPTVGQHREPTVLATERDHESVDRSMRLLLRSSERYVAYEEAAERLFPELHDS